MRRAGPILKRGGAEVLVNHEVELLLRAPLVADAEQALVMLHDHDISWWNPADAVVDLPSATAWCERGADWSTGRHATFHIIATATDELVGTVSLFAIIDEVQIARIGYRVAPAWRGKGVARRVVSAVAEWGFSTRELERISLEHALDNPASCRVAESAGFAFEGVERSADVDPLGQRRDCHLHARLAGDPAPPLAPVRIVEPS